jgi:hypothetical protein
LFNLEMVDQTGIDAAPKRRVAFDAKAINSKGPAKGQRNDVLAAIVTVRFLLKTFYAQHRVFSTRLIRRQ